MRNGFLYALFALLFVAALVFTFVHPSPQSFLDSLFSKSYTYNQTEQGVSFVSNDAPPSKIIPALASSEAFILVLHGVAGSTPLNSAMGNALIQQQIVLGGHQKITTTIMKGYDVENGKWLNCQTDYGTGKQNETITPEECASLLNPSNSVVWEIHFPNTNRSSPTVELSPNKIIFYPKTATEIVPVTFLILKSMYPDAGAIINAANATIENQPSPPFPSDSNS